MRPGKPRLWTLSCGINLNMSFIMHSINLGCNCMLFVSLHPIVEWISNEQRWKLLGKIMCLGVEFSTIFRVHVCLMSNSVDYPAKRLKALKTEIVVLSPPHLVTPKMFSFKVSTYFQGYDCADFNENAKRMP